jgi:2-oxoglutarate dehydrogenase complex dehydrogenase (E1) component-like enzyme
MKRIKINKLLIIGLALSCLMVVIGCEGEVAPKHLEVAPKHLIDETIVDSSNDGYTYYYTVDYDKENSQCTISRSYQTESAKKKGILPKSDSPRTYNLTKDSCYLNTYWEICHMKAATDPLSIKYKEEAEKVYEEYGYSEKQQKKLRELSEKNTELIKKNVIDCMNNNSRIPKNWKELVLILG